jgi:hypothetical protein
MSALIGCRIGLGVSVVLAFTGCASILGVEEASCDPRFDDACREGATTGDDSSEASEEGEPDAGQKDAGGQSSAPPAKEAACARYCADVMEHCTEFPQYLNEDSCNVVCNGMLPLAGGDAGVLDDTLECRASIAGDEAFFSEDPKGSCETAGPMGVDCGDDCVKYCDYMQRFCPEETEILAGDCVAKCRTIPRKDVYVFTNTDYDNTLECRFIHIQLSIQVSPKRLDHCSHAAGESLCVD